MLETDTINEFGHGLGYIISGELCYYTPESASALANILRQLADVIEYREDMIANLLKINSSLILLVEAKLALLESINENK
jgi:hypothetical protein